jgi:hypothetical protein
MPTCPSVQTPLFDASDAAHLHHDCHVSTALHGATTTPLTMLVPVVNLNLLVCIWQPLKQLERTEVRRGTILVAVDEANCWLSELDSCDRDNSARATHGR